MHENHTVQEAKIVAAVHVGMQALATSTTPYEQTLLCFTVLLESDTIQGDNVCNIHLIIW